MQEHPDAQLYRKKSVPGYHKLCFIYGQESFNQRSNYLVNSVDMRSTDPDLLIGMFLVSAMKIKIRYSVVDGPTSIFSSCDIGG